MLSNVSIDDPDSGGVVVQPVTATFAVWPLSNPNERLEWTTHESYAPTTFSFPLPTGYAREGGFSGERFDGDADSQVCRCSIRGPARR